MSTKYQTISQFMRKPFNTTDSIGMEKAYKYEQRYKEYIAQNKIRIEGYTQIEDSYYIHAKVPSESKSTTDNVYEYDVVIRFFTTEPDVKKQLSLRGYYIQFFSNSPGFMYRYAALYKKYGYLIDILYDKLDPEYKDVLPEKTNSNMNLSFDSTIYFTCKYLSEYQFRLLNKVGIIMQKKKSPEKFLADITDFKSAKFDAEIINLEKQLKKEIGKEKKSSDKSDKNQSRRTNNTHIKKATNSTSSIKSITHITKKTGSKRKTKSKITSKSSTTRK